MGNEILVIENDFLYIFKKQHFNLLRNTNEYICLNSLEVKNFTIRDIFVVAGIVDDDAILKRAASEDLSNIIFMNCLMCKRLLSKSVAYDCVDI